MGKIKNILPYSDENGVTLVELLAVISLLSLIILSISSIHLFAQKQANNQANETQIQSDERLALNVLTKEIRKAETVEVNNQNEIIINGTDVYKLNGKTIEKNGEPCFSNIFKFTVTKEDKQIDLIINNLPEVTIYMRE